MADEPRLEDFLNANPFSSNNPSTDTDADASPAHTGPEDADTDDATGLFDSEHIAEGDQLTENADPQAEEEPDAPEDEPADNAEDDSDDGHDDGGEDDRPDDAGDVDDEPAGKRGHLLRNLSIAATAIILPVAGFAALGGFDTSNNSNADSQAASLSAPETTAAERSLSPDEILAERGRGSATKSSERPRLRVTGTSTSSKPKSSSSRSREPRMSGTNTPSRRAPSQRQQPPSQARPAEPVPQPEPAPTQTPQPAPEPGGDQVAGADDRVVANQPEITETVTHTPEVSTVYQSPDRR